MKILASADVMIEEKMWETLSRLPLNMSEFLMESEALMESGEKYSHVFLILMCEILINTLPRLTGKHTEKFHHYLTKLAQSSRCRSEFVGKALSLLFCLLNDSEECQELMLSLVYQSKVSKAILVNRKIG